MNQKCLFCTRILNNIIQVFYFISINIESGNQ